MDKTTKNSRYALLATWLKQKRQERNLTIRELAELIDEPFQFVSKVENCERKLNVYEYVQYCDAMGIDATEGFALLKKKKTLP